MERLLKVDLQVRELQGAVADAKLFLYDEREQVGYSCAALSCLRGFCGHGSCGTVHIALPHLAPTALRSC